MSDSPRIGLMLDLASEDDLTWHRDTRFVAAMIDGLTAHGLWFGFDRMSLADDAVPLDRKRLAAATADWKKGHLELHAGDDPEVAYAGIDTGGVLATLRMHSPPLGARGAAILDGMIAWVRQAGAAAAGRARLRSGAVYPLDISYPQRRPPLVHDYVRFGTLVDFFGIAWCEAEMPDVAPAITAGALPAGASRILDGDLVVLRWIDGDPADPLEQVRACVRQEDWWAVHAGARIDDGWNAEGDQAVYPTELEPRPPFTLFDADEGAGYRAVVVMPDGDLDGATWPEIAQLTAMRALPDGARVEKVRLIVPVRDSAIAIADRARALGVEAVVYRGDDETLWNVIPPGQWRDPEREAR